jgi:hypothetical protein
MPKVVTGSGMQEFVETGKHEVMKPDRAKKEKDAPVLEAVKAPVVLEVTEPKAEDKKPDEPEDTGLEAEDNDLAERAQKRISKKHREMKQAEALAKRLQSELEDTENFSKSQFDRARMAEDKLSQIERELTELKGKAVPKVEETNKRPDAKDKKYYDEQGQFKAFEYAEDLAGFSAAQAVAKDRKEQDEARTQAKQQELIQAFQARLEKAREKYPDFKQVVGADETPVPPYVQNFMVKSQFGGDLGYWFAKNPTETARIFALPPDEAIAEIGEIQAQWKKKDTKEEASNVVPIIPKAGAPAPIKPLQPTGAGSVNVDPSKMDFQQLRAFRREQERAKRSR